MKNGFCTSCGSALEPNARFCANCGGALVDGDIRPPPTPVPAATPAGAQIPVPLPPRYLNPPRNPRLLASDAAGVVVLVSGIFALIFGNMVLYWDAWDTGWDIVADEEVTFLNTGAFFAGMMFLVAFLTSVASCYCALRLIRYEIAVAGPVTLLIAYFSTLAYESFMLVISVQILILSIVSLGLLYYAIPIYAGRKVKESRVRPMDPTPPPAI